ncbi:MAG: RHS repeat-associated core domain-containing protein [Paramuribaculum sp.]
MIVQLSHNEAIANKSPGVYGQIDDITATFCGNQLSTLRDAAATVLLEASLDLPCGEWAGSDFCYDFNGNQTRDMSRGVSDVSYNVLNLPQRVEFASGARIDYLYSASGTKLAEIVYDTDGALISRRDYVGQFEFVADTLERMLLPEGYITAADSTFHVFIPDYQGNIVGVYNSATNTLEQFTDYYPYGLPHASATAPTVNRRKYGAKELTTDHGLNLYDFAARWHNPAFPHFTTPDPLAEKYYSTSPFAYCAADPINLIDPTGESPVYDMGGNYLGCTSEGFTGMILIYVGTEIIDPAKYSNAELKTFAGADLMTYDEARESNNTEILESAYSRIWTYLSLKECRYMMKFSLCRQFPEVKSDIKKKKEQIGKLHM